MASACAYLPAALLISLSLLSYSRNVNKHLIGSKASTRTVIPSQSFNFSLSVTHTHSHTYLLSSAPPPSSLSLSLCLPRHVSERAHMDQACEKRRRFKNMRAQSQTRRLCLSFFASGSPVCLLLFTFRPFNRHHVLSSILKSFPLFSAAVIPIYLCISLFFLLLLVFLYISIQPILFIYCSIHKLFTQLLNSPLLK